MKKVLVCLLSVVLALSVLGCSSGNASSGLSSKSKTDYSVFELNGKKYNLSGDTDEVIKSFAQDGFALINSLSTRVEYLDDNGEFIQEGYGSYIRGEEKNVRSPIIYGKYHTIPIPDIVPHYYTYYSLNPVYEDYGYPPYNYQTAHGITNNSTIEDIESLEGFLPCYSNMPSYTTASDTGYFIIYVDGVQINIEEYRNKWETIINLGSSDSSALEAIMSYPYSSLLSNFTMPQRFWSLLPLKDTDASLDVLKTICEEDKRYKYSLLASLVSAEALQKALEGDVNTIEIYIYTDSEYGPITDYFVFNADTMLNQEETP